MDNLDNIVELILKTLDECRPSNNDAMIRRIAARCQLPIEVVHNVLLGPLVALEKEKKEPPKDDFMVYVKKSSDSGSDFYQLVNDELLEPDEEEDDESKRKKKAKKSTESVPEKRCKRCEAAKKHR
ncbi:uncharacterized protein LOC119671152 [Teleopsis dalmanni]|uniref:uncharacterized protein LOC119671152 n=1 Tax=Teleopsis dalmanni TaxID=139649 RepID=UPI0018CF88B8|nr:uncharacterized protein LOC119671152 [Teleopsis dalmanni]XP_037937612.1 uncharacterized protein LOC119671152 [Teleopsis dalmanni]XP_037937613.1 uncharacterized protein LOC119671152 [Teleopsis dalmanni]